MLNKRTMILMSDTTPFPRFFGVFSDPMALEIRKGVKFKKFKKSTKKLSALSGSKFSRL
jgi:hypothetical protein